ncbi:protein containing DUF1814 [Candidatus Magnetomorum sp. HK-1]|nr:protein containing DUF1814 [Candidatus Magnetomorum sp. HK-1]
MSGKKEIHINILTEIQKEVLDSLTVALQNTDFYMAGGTALALQIGHRLSIDFDWFTTRIDDPEIVFSILKSHGINFKIVNVSYETIYIEINGVQVSFIGYDYYMLCPCKSYIYNTNTLKLASIDDIACMKLSAIASRGSRKDFVDLYFIINKYRSLNEYLQLYMKKFQNRDIGHVIRSLVYFEDAETEIEIVCMSSFQWKELKKKFETWVKELFKVGEGVAS